MDELIGEQDCYIVSAYLPTFVHGKRKWAVSQKLPHSCDQG